MPGRKTSDEKLPELLRLAVLLRDGGSCSYCGKGWGLGVAIHVDHLLPRAWQGKDVPENLAAACEDCNTLKGTCDLEAFAGMLERHGRIASAAALIASVRARAAKPLDLPAAARLLKVK